MNKYKIWLSENKTTIISADGVITTEDGNGAIKVIFGLNDSIDHVAIFSNIKGWEKIKDEDNI